VQMPVNQAIENIEPTTLEFLLEPGNVADLQNLLLYHVIPGSFSTSDLSSGAAPTLLPGLGIDISTSPIMFNFASVVTPNIPASNGFIHTIDSVLRFQQGKVTFETSSFLTLSFYNRESGCNAN